MTRIIAIGGGDLNNGDTLSIDKQIISFSGMKNPKLLFMPTASYDSEEYSLIIKNYFEDLGCSVDILKLRDRYLTDHEIRSRILESNIIYVGGGNTLRMMNVWRRRGVDKILNQARLKGTVLTGLSAGSICWFKYGNSDSRRFTSNSDKLIKVSGLGFINALHCPHYDSEVSRKSDLKRMMKNVSEVGIAIEDGCAIQIKGDQYRILRSKENTKAYKVYWRFGVYNEEEIRYSSKYKPLDNLIKK